jgi:uncharacterized protein YjbI with pentapeptide repeats
MKSRSLAALTLLTSLVFAAPAQAEDLRHTQQLMSTRECQNCDLSRAGFVYANLSGVNLQGTNLSEANLTRANLSNANLQGADFRGAVLYNINLSGADLSGANLSGVDLRDAYLEGANFQGANLEGANLMGSIGIPEGVVTAEDYYRWGLTADQQGNFSGAITYYNEALAIDPDFAHAYLARGVSRYRLRDTNGALADAQKSEQLYLAQGNETGHQASIQFSEGIQAVQEAQANAGRGGGGGGNFLGFLGSLSSLLVRFLLP